MTLTKYSNLSLLHMPDCVGLMENGRCSRLDVKLCEGDGCALKKTRDEQSDALKKSMSRLLSLDEKTQAQIARKYYGGKRVWLEWTPANDERYGVEV